MRFVPASRLATRQTDWVAYRSDGTAFNRLTSPTGHHASIWAAQFEETYAEDVTPVTFGD